MKTTSRRSFVSAISTTGAGLLLLPAGSALGYRANEKIDVAFVGVQGVARGYFGRMKRLAEQANVTALCDVDSASLAKRKAEHPQAGTFRDYREMLTEQKNIDAVVVSTPDHTHYPASIFAMQQGKAVTTEKPMAHTVWEARQLGLAATHYGVATQMDNEHHAAEALRLQVEWIQAGAIGEVREVHIYTNRPVWPQGMDKRPDPSPPPETIDWDLWIGAAPFREHHAGLHPFKWRGWWDFGTGALGDMGCHQFDPVFWALKLGSPSSVEAVTEGVTDEAGPSSGVVTYEFPARGDLPPVTVKWFEGKAQVPRPPALEKDRKMRAGGIIYYGSEETIVASHPPSTRIVPETRMKAFQRPPKTVERSPGHTEEWFEAIRGGKPASSNFPDYSGPLTELVLLGNLAMRTGKKIVWDAQNLKAVDCPEADEFIRREYRDGWDFGTPWLDA